MSVLLDRIMEGSMVLLIIGIFLAFARAVRGPRFTDRIVAINMIGTMTTAIICILSAYLKESMLVDVALVYTLLSFLAVVIICHVVNERDHSGYFHLHGHHCICLVTAGNLPPEICDEPYACGSNG
mgnify:CR=1 FL=1